MDKEIRFKLIGLCVLGLVPTSVLSPIYFKSYYSDRCNYLRTFCNTTINFCDDNIYKNEYNELKICNDFFIAAVCFSSLAGISAIVLQYLLYDKYCRKVDEDLSSPRRSVVIQVS